MTRTRAPGRYRRSVSGSPVRDPVTEVVIAIDAACGFPKHLSHGGGATARSPAMLTHLYAAILAQAMNPGSVAMARASGLSYDPVAHATAWYLREETLVPAIDEVVNYPHRPAARRWGDGTFSSSDGQRFPVQVKAANAGALPRYFGFGKLRRRRSITASARASHPSSAPCSSR